MSRGFFQVSHSRNYTINNSSVSVIHINDNQIIASQTMNQKFVHDQSRKIENQGGNVTGNVLGDESNIRNKVTENYPQRKRKVTANSSQPKLSPQPKIEKQKKFGFLDFLTWMQNGQILFILISSIIGILLLIIYPKLYPDGLPGWTKPIQDIIPAPQTENESNS